MDSIISDLNLTVVYIQFNQHIISISSNIPDMHFFKASEGYKDYVAKYGEFSPQKKDDFFDKVFKPDYTNTVITYDCSSSGSMLMGDIISALQLFEVEGESIYKIMCEIRKLYYDVGNNMLLSTIQIFNRVFSRTIEMDNEICSVTKQSSLAIDENHIFIRQ